MTYPTITEIPKLREQAVISRILMFLTIGNECQESSHFSRRANISTAFCRKESEGLCQHLCLSVIIGR